MPKRTKHAGAGPIGAAGAIPAAREADAAAEGRAREADRYAGFFYHYDAAPLSMTIPATKPFTRCRSIPAPRVATAAFSAIAGRERPAGPS